MLNVSATESVAPAAILVFVQMRVVGLQVQPVGLIPARDKGVMPPGKAIVRVRPGVVAVVLLFVTTMLTVSYGSPCMKVVVRFVYAIVAVGVPEAPIGVSKVNCMLGVPA